MSETDRSAPEPTLAGDPARAGRAWRSPSAWVLLLAVLALGLSADLWTKSWCYANVGGDPVVLERADLLTNPGFDPIGRRAGKPVLPWGLLEFKLVLNPGAVFGIGSQQRWFFIVFTLGALGAGLLVFGHYTATRSRIAHVAIGLVLAGGLGNLHDRIVFGRVRDFLHMLPGRRLPFEWTWPGTNNPELFPWVFNVADLLLLVGMIGLMVHVNGVEKRRKGELEAEVPATTAAARPTAEQEGDPGPQPAE